MVSPDTGNPAAFLAALRAFSLMCAPLTPMLATQWLLDGTVQRILAGLRDEAHARQAIAAWGLAGAIAHASCEGIHLWLELPSDWAAPAFARAARGARRANRA